ncbi:MAG TPA: peptidoglycan DD-metalloendopeptidase family protein, partial [Sphingomicrobium sp.]|nr:peptidoglycan DD-metalloendopeptidase family protein [Sphingomicrobium sp.]
LDVTAARALAEARSAEARMTTLQKAADAAKDEAERLRAKQAAATQAIEAAEARISVADANARLIGVLMAERRDRLAREQAPAGSLLAGLALMAERPPLLAILDQGSTEEFVRVRLLLDSTLPVIRRRTAALRNELERGRKLQARADLARRDLVQSRDTLARRKREFAELETEALKIAAKRGGEALGAGDIALARGEEAHQLLSAAENRREAVTIAGELARMPPPPARPGSQAPAFAPLAYRLPADAPVVEGLGSVAPNGVRSRGLTLRTPRGSTVVAPASGTIRFAGAYRSFDGVVIIDHGGGWMSLLLGVSTQQKPGTRVSIGDPLGRALRPIGVELSRNGQHVSPALIAGSSRSLSKDRKEG